MSGIVCAIRGGPASQPTIERAITLAKETDLPLYFIYVVNLDFFTHTQSSRTHTVEKDLHNMGEFILLDAQAKADKEGVHAEGIVRQGSIGDEIIAVSNELDVNYVVLGSPQGVQDADAFTQDHFSEFVSRVQEECGAEVIYLIPKD
jgi:nucleotide-binding universal stress UspA family protein